MCTWSWSINIFSRLGIVHIVCGILDVVWQTGATVILESDPFIYITVINKYEVFRTASGIWIGLFNILTGIIGLFCRRKLARRLKKPLLSPDIIQQSPRTVEAFTGLSIIATLLNGALIIMHAYMLSVFHEVIKRRQNYEYQHTYVVYVIVMFVLSFLLVITGAVEFVAHIIGSAAACRDYTSSAGNGAELSSYSILTTQMTRKTADSTDPDTVGWTMAREKRVNGQARTKLLV